MLICTKCNETFDNLKEKEVEFYVGEYEGQNYYKKGFEYSCPYCNADEDEVEDLETFLSNRFDDKIYNGIIDDEKMTVEEINNILEDDEYFSLLKYKVEKKEGLLFISFE